MHSCCRPSRRRAPRCRREIAAAGRYQTGTMRSQGQTASTNKQRNRPETATRNEPRDRKAAGSTCSAAVSPRIGHCMDSTHQRWFRAAAVPRLTPTRTMQVAQCRTSRLAHLPMGDAASSVAAAHHPPRALLVRRAAEQQQTRELLYIAHTIATRGAQRFLSALTHCCDA